MQSSKQYIKLKCSQLQVVWVICNSLWIELMCSYKSALRAVGYSCLKTAWIHLLILFRAMHAGTHSGRQPNEHYRQFSLNEKFIWIWPQKVSISILIRWLYWSVYVSVSSVTNVGLLALWCTIYVCSSLGVFLRDRVSNSELMPSRPHLHTWQHGPSSFL